MRPFSYEVTWISPTQRTKVLGRAKSLLDAANLARKYDFVPHHFTIRAHYLNGESHFVPQHLFAIHQSVSADFARKRIRDHHAVSVLINESQHEIIRSNIVVGPRYGVHDPLEIQIKDYMNSEIWTWKTDEEIRSAFGENIPAHTHALPCAICMICGKTYDEHLYCLNFEDYDGNPFLRVICDGTLAKVG